jgi:ABC-2 type transport system ATP-binding protein
VLSILDISKRFGAVEALAGCSFTVERGRMLGFLGPNGAGKTTAMRAVFGLVALDAGELLWDGRPIGLAERLRFGYMPEERGLYRACRSASRSPTSAACTDWTRAKRAPPPRIG